MSCKQEHIITYPEQKKVRYSWPKSFIMYIKLQWSFLHFCYAYALDDLIIILFELFSKYKIRFFQFYLMSHFSTFRCFGKKIVTICLISCKGRLKVSKSGKIHAPHSLE